MSLQVTMSYLQIYQEKIYDLLNSTNKVELSLREHPVKGMHGCIAVKSNAPFKVLFVNACALLAT